MAEHTNIEWADSTLNVWEGCQETGSPACVGCYARARNLRYAPKGTTEAPNWGPKAPRREVKSWRATLRKISRKALAAFAAGRTEPWFVFVNSLSDFWDNQADPALRREALDEFRKYPHLTFLLLTKRPQMIVKLFREMILPPGAIPNDLGRDILTNPSLVFPRNVAIGCTVVTQAEADRDIPWLLKAKATLQPAFAFLSMEPLAEIVDLIHVKVGDLGTLSALADIGARIDWVITGGATDQGKHKAYPTPYAAFRKVRDDCAKAGVAYLHKQNGEFAEVDLGPFVPPAGTVPAQVVTITQQGPDGLTYETGHVQRIGKKAAGRMLDGRTHDDRPAVRHLEAA